MSSALEQFEQRRIELDKELIAQYRELNIIISMVQRKQYTCEHCGNISHTVADPELVQETIYKASKLKQSFNIAFSKIEEDYRKEGKIKEREEIKDE